MNQGWECPKCGKCYGPQVQQCWTCGKTTYNPPIYPVYPQPYYPTTWPYVTWTVGGGNVSFTTSDKWILINNTDPDDPDSGVGAKV